MSKNRTSYVAAQERFSVGTGTALSHKDVAAIPGACFRETERACLAFVELRWHSHSFGQPKLKPAVEMVSMQLN